MNEYKRPYVIVDGEQVLTANYHELDMWRVRMSIDRAKHTAVTATVLSIIAIAFTLLSALL